jgi:hypothetical protein
MIPTKIEDLEFSPCDLPPYKSCSAYFENVYSAKRYELNQIVNHAKQLYSGDVSHCYRLIDTSTCRWVAVNARRRIEYFSNHEQDMVDLIRDIVYLMTTP